MIGEERLLKVLNAPHISEKASSLNEKNNTFVFKVDQKAKKKEIQLAVKKLLDVEVEKVRTLIVKGKVKRHSQRFGRRPNWKKAYVTLKKGQNLDLTNNAV